MKIEDGYFSIGKPEYIGSFPIKQELEILPVDPTIKGWTVNKWISIDGNKYIRLLNRYLRKIGKISENELSKEEIEKLLSKCEIK
jgi:hypothetical protein